MAAYATTSASTVVNISNLNQGQSQKLWTLLMLNRTFSGQIGYDALDEWPLTVPELRTDSDCPLRMNIAREGVVGSITIKMAAHGVAQLQAFYGRTDDQEYQEYHPALCIRSMTAVVDRLARRIAELEVTPSRSHSSNFELPRLGFAV